MYRIGIVRCFTWECGEFGAYITKQPDPKDIFSSITLTIFYIHWHKYKIRALEFFKLNRDRGGK